MDFPLGTTKMAGPIGVGKNLVFLRRFFDYKRLTRRMGKLFRQV